MYEKYRNQNFSFIAINVIPDQNDMLPGWKAKGKYTFPIVVMDKGDFFAKNDYGVQGTPTNFLLNDGGKVVFRHIGYSPGAEKVMEAEIREVLGLDPFEGMEPPQKTETAEKK